MSRAAKGADCKSAGAAFVGSSPTSPTRWSEERDRRTRSGGVELVGDPAHDAAAKARGCSSMVEQQPSKLNTRVRFPSPAPIGPNGRGGSGVVEYTGV